MDFGPRQGKLVERTLCKVVSIEGGVATLQLRREGRVFQLAHPLEECPASARSIGVSFFLGTYDVGSKHVPEYTYRSIPGSE